MWFIGVEVEQETSAPPPKKNPGSTLVQRLFLGTWGLSFPVWRFFRIYMSVKIS